jgi:hypothetical protein
VGFHCVYSSIIIEMLLKLYKIGIRCRFLPVTYVISSSYTPRELFMCCVKGAANSGKRKYAVFVTVTVGCLTGDVLLAFSVVSCWSCLYWVKGFLWCRFCWFNLEIVTSSLWGMLWVITSKCGFDQYHLRLYGLD